MATAQSHVEGFFAGENRAAVELVGQIRRQIAEGELRPGDRLLSERRLSQRHRVPLHAVRVALGQLKREGLVRSRSKSGVYITDAPASASGSASGLPVAKPRDAAAALTPAMVPPGEVEGFHLLDAPRHIEHDLRVLVTNWNRRTRPLWQRLCDDYTRQRPEVRITPIFPPRVADYEHLRASCDVFLSCHQTLLNEPVARLNLASFDRDELEAAGIDPRYIEAVAIEPGAAETFAVPLSACLLQGFLNTRALPTGAARQLQHATSWEELFERLIDLASAPGHHPLNFCPIHTFNLSQFLMLAAGGPLDERGQFDMNRPAVIEAIELAESYLDRAGAREPFDPDGYPQRPCPALIEYSYRAAFACTPEDGWEPWMYPLGPQGKAIEAINFGVVNRHSLHIDEAKRFLLHLASPEAQARFATVPGEHPVSRRVGEPFQAYPEPYRRVFHQVRERAEVLRELVPGYFVAINALRLAGKQWFHHHMTAQDVCVTVERQRRRHLHRYTEASVMRNP